MFLFKKRKRYSPFGSILTIDTSEFVSQRLQFLSVTANKTHTNLGRNVLAQLQIITK